MKKFALLLMIMCLFYMSDGQAFAEVKWEELFNKQINSWVNELSKKDPLFNNWSEATYKTESLGPNSRQWLVTLYNKDQRVGYLIITENEKDQFLLLEYGVEEISLFDPDLISIYYPKLKSDVKEILNRYEGLSSHFMVKTKADGEILIDAKTGELIPKEFYHKPDGVHHNISFTLTPNELLYSFTKSLSEYDEAFPIEAIIKRKSILKELDQVNKNNTYLKTTTWNGKINLLLPVIGYHKWSEGVNYIAIEQEGYRFLPIFKIKETDGSIPSVCIEDIIIIESDSEVVQAPALRTFLLH